MTKQIKKLLIDRELSIAELARRIGMSRTWVSLVINGNMKSPETRRRIADELKVKVQALWPEEETKKRAA